MKISKNVADADVKFLLLIDLSIKYILVSFFKTYFSLKKHTYIQGVDRMRI